MKCMMGECGNEVGGNIWYVGGVVVRGDIKIQVLATARFCKQWQQQVYQLYPRFANI